MSDTVLRDRACVDRWESGSSLSSQGWRGPMRFMKGTDGKRNERDRTEKTKGLVQKGRKENRKQKLSTE